MRARVFILFSVFLAASAIFINACSKTYTVGPLAIIPATFTPTPITGLMVTTLAGSVAPGFINGIGTAAAFNSPFGLAVDSSGNVYVGDFGNNAIRIITPGGVVSNYAGAGVTYGSTNGAGSIASFYGPANLAMDISGNLFVGDSNNEIIRKITPTDIVSTFAGQAGVTGYLNGIGTSALFFYPFGIAVDSTGNLFVADTGNYVIRQITSTGVVSTLAGQAGVTGSTNGTGLSALFYNPESVAVDALDNVYVADMGNNMIRKISSGGVVTTLAGSGSSGSSNGLGSAASFNKPSGIAIDSSGNILVCDSGNYLIRKITIGGLVTTLAGTGISGLMNGPVATAKFLRPYSITVDISGKIYIADYNCIRVIQ